MLCLSAVHGNGLRVLDLNGESRLGAAAGGRDGHEAGVELAGGLAALAGRAGGDGVVLVLEDVLDGVADGSGDAGGGEGQLLVAADVDLVGGGEDGRGVEQDGREAGGCELHFWIGG
jgi:hypothetical protein